MARGCKCHPTLPKPQDLIDGKRVAAEGGDLVDLWPGPVCPGCGHAWWYMDEKTKRMTCAMCGEPSTVDNKPKH